ncbi:MAG: hypothetical protein Tp172MES593141_17 [Prokaryotic dsDNA virus sp.]|nr:MAG: hypothetical protein Tp172MES593141_17 [Prokaryotic dsDNA virus sp.]|tara:strand:+ start:774 stop:1376 length:603 start_codon:yes stop_codon:yes gene_type:complete
MKVAIKKKGKKKQYKLIESWEDVTLEKWIKLININDNDKSKEALETIALLSDIPKKLINQLGIQDVALILSKIAELQKKANSSLKKIIEINGKRYGFHPSLSDITLGEYADIEAFMKNDLQQNLANVMAILYRPIIEEGENGFYTIEPYDGKIDKRAEEMKKMSSEQVQSALVFFWIFVKGLLMTLELSLIRSMKETKQQ